ncbi:GDP-D-glucose phosphorylase 1 isoform X2 [Orussus abietinus]|uniref:GDP-D-glucose phosphorylase 1 isoform X2 n=1 Tax=Orussus abietinus TaxID=222816 RepID=UPI000C7162AB|nr:GDP-D-glucose phosphorylase 1 isoform X2 [Orussus abietinus]
MLNIDNTIPIFRYESKNFNFHLNDCNKRDSEFDTVLMKKWLQAESDGVFRYNLKIAEWKILEGKHHYLVQLNLDRVWNRRKPENISSMLQPFDASRFNFTKLPNREIFFDIGDGSGNDIIAGNVSPIESGHCLLLHQRFQCLSQQVTKNSLCKALELLLLSNSPLCAHASVNHLHWHLYYLKHQMPLECIEISELIHPVFLLTNVPSNGFCLKLSSFSGNSIDCLNQLTFWVYLIVDYLQKHEIAHNVYITRAKTKPNESIYDDVRIYIWARKSSCGVKNTTAFVPAVSELFGHIVTGTEEAYRNLNENTIAEILTDITEDTFNAVKGEIFNLVKKNVSNDI